MTISFSDAGKDFRNDQRTIDEVEKELWDAIDLWPDTDDTDNQ